MVGRTEIAASVILPHFDAVRDVFAEYQPDGGDRLRKLKSVKLEVTDSARDSERHFAGCRDDGLLIRMAPDAADLPINTLVAILAHEFGHAADFAFPGRWLVTAGADADASWLPSDGSKTLGNEKMRERLTGWRKAWAHRAHDEVEWAADAIAHLVTGQRIGYCGPCMLQCFGGGQRPAGLR